MRSVTFRNKGTNAALVAPAGHIVLEAQSDADKHDNLPHNQFVLANLSTTTILFVFLDDFSDQDKPDYVLLPQQSLAVDYEQGEKFTTMFIKNTHAVNNLAAKELKYNIQTNKEV